MKHHFTFIALIAVLTALLLLGLSLKQEIIFDNFDDLIKVILIGTLAYFFLLFLKMLPSPKEWWHFVYLPYCNL
jgi:Mn2+/Fe2+ NRAMP family transporter